MLPLQGVRVIELANNIAGPYAGSILGMLGADVLKIERPQSGDDARDWGPPFHDGMSLLFHALNLNKRSITLDLKNAAQSGWLKAQIASCDVLVQNLRPGAMEELGLGSAAMLELNPRLIYCSIGAFGNQGPMRRHAGYEPMVQALSGIFSVNGEADRPGVRVGVQLLDMGSAMWAALGCVAGLLERERTGKGAVVDTSLFETALGWLTVHFAGYRATAELPVRHASGSPRVVVFEAFDAADGQIVIAAGNDRLFAKLAAALGCPEWSDDERFRTNRARVVHKDALIPMIAEIVRGAPRSHWLQRLETAGVPSAPINDLNDVMALPQTQAVGMILPAPGSGLELMGLPISFNGQRPPIRRRAPRLGEHRTDAVGLPGNDGAD